MKAALILTAAKQDELMRIHNFAEAILQGADEGEIWLCKDVEEEEAALQAPSGVKGEMFFSQGLVDKQEVSLVWLMQMWEERRPDALLFYDNIAGHELAVRMGMRLGVEAITDVFSLERRGNALLALRKSCGAYLDWETTIATYPTVISVARGRGRPLNGEMKAITLRAVPLAEPLSHSPILARQSLEKREENPLESCRLLFVGGKGLGSRNACEALREVATKYGATPGFTRPVALNGWCGLHEIVGQSGLRTSPEICVAFGVSGAAAFLTGVRDAQKLVAVNTDPDAPIFRHADVGIVADARGLLAEMG